jgi:short subunit fatty acids transporter
MNNFFRWFGLPGSFVLTVLMSLLALVLAVCFRTKTTVSRTRPRRRIF